MVKVKFTLDRRTDGQTDNLTKADNFLITTLENNLYRRDLENNLGLLRLDRQTDRQTG